MASDNKKTEQTHCRRPAESQAGSIDCPAFSTFAQRFHSLEQCTFWTMAQPAICAIRQRQEQQRQRERQKRSTDSSSTTRHQQENRSALATIASQGAQRNMLSLETAAQKVSMFALSLDAVRTTFCSSIQPCDKFLQPLTARTGQMLE